MPIPSQTFTTMAQLLAYINSLIVPNGNNLITGDETNNVLNGISNFIINYSVNAKLAPISTSSGVVHLAKPITIFIVVPASIDWPDNVQFEYYIVNGTGTNIPLTSGFSYVDQYGVVQTVIPFRTAIHIAKAVNGTWFQVNNLGGTAGGGLPPTTGHQGQFLETDGNSAFWNDPVIEITSANFSDSTHYNNTNLVNNRFALMWDDLPSRIYTNLSNPTYPASSWIYIGTGGFQILIPGFDATQNQYHFTLWLKGITS